MKIGIVFDSLSGIMQQERKLIAKAVTTGIKRSGSGLQNELRRQVKTSGLGNDLQKAWRKAIYPKTGFSSGAAAHIYSKATRIHDAFMENRIIQPSNARWLVIPLPIAVEKSWHLNRQKTVSGAGKDRKWSNIIAAGKLQFIKTHSNRGLLVKKEGKKIIPYFLLVKQVRLKKLLDLDSPAKKWIDKLPGYIVKEMARLDKA